MRSLAACFFFLLAGCPSPAPAAPKFAVAQENLGAAVLAVWGSSATDVYVVGGEDRSGDRDGLGPIVLHYDGGGWERLDTGQRGVDLWWVFGFAGGPVFMGGTQGTLLRYEGGSFTRMTTPGMGTVFGIWGATPDDVWAVGGQAGTSGFAWRYDGSTWTDAEIPMDISTEGTIWKITGRTADDVLMTGTIGYTGHWDGTTLSRADVPVDISLFGVACNPDSCVTVGGQPAILAEDHGDGWVTAELPSGVLSLSGAAMSDRDAYAVGAFATILQRRDGVWQFVDEEIPTYQGLHAVWIDPDGGTWVVGGMFQAFDTTDGVVLYRGRREVTP